ncbi:Lactate-responsive regulator LldR in Enterobacteria, GntR family [Raoultella ornithinolytica]|nr:Lactate-responsive regulator LldR in Enterobacteria, GntR family [Raoultella ornithinolytica]
MEAIFAGDAEGARQAMMAHLGFVHATIKHFDEGPGPPGANYPPAR